MAISESIPTRKNKVLIITSSGGGGLLQAAKAKEQEIREKDPEATVILRDVMKDWTYKRFGQGCVALWNRAQRKGSVAGQAILGALSPMAEYLFWPYIFFYSLKTLFKEDIDRVIDTQVMGTSAIIKALRLFNHIRRKQVQLEKVLVDLPTKKASHFFIPIKALSEKDRKLIRLVTIPPLLEHGQTEEQFWLKYCNLSVLELQYEDFYVRQAFRKFRNSKREEIPFSFSIRYKNAEELELMQQTLQRGSAIAKIKENRVEFSLSPTDLLFTILLGSQPANEATLNYVKGFLQMAQEFREKKQAIYLFVFCADHTPGEETLFKKVSETVLKEENYPSFFSVIPMSFQTDEAIAPLFFRSDATCTRCGGQTAMELMAIAQGQVWIHSEAKKGPLTNEALLDGIPGWESANAVYLQHARKAKLVTPENFIGYARELIEQKVGS